MSTDVYDIKTLDAQAKALGLDGCRDLNQLKKYKFLWSSDNLYLEVGAGSGRVIDWLKKQPHLAIFAIEESEEKAKYLFKKYPARKGLYLNSKLRFKIDVAFMMFSTLFEFASSVRQKECLIFIYDLLEEGGHLVIDNLAIDSKYIKRIPQKTKRDGSKLTLLVPDKDGVEKKLQLNLISLKELKEMASSVGFKFVTSKTYSLKGQKRYHAIWKKHETIDY